MILRDTAQLHGQGDQDIIEAARNPTNPRDDATDRETDIIQLVRNNPETMIKLYGSANGFGWKHHVAVGSQIVSVPLAMPLAKARNEFINQLYQLLAEEIPTEQERVRFLSGRNRLH